MPVSRKKNNNRKKLRWVILYRRRWEIMFGIFSVFFYLFGFFLHFLFCCTEVEEYREWDFSIHLQIYIFWSVVSRNIIPCVIYKDSFYCDRNTRRLRTKNRPSGSAIWQVIMKCYFIAKAIKFNAKTKIWYPASMQNCFFLCLSYCYTPSKEQVV